MRNMQIRKVILSCTVVSRIVCLVAQVDLLLAFLVVYHLFEAVLILVMLVHFYCCFSFVIYANA